VEPRVRSDQYEIEEFEAKIRLSTEGEGGAESHHDWIHVETIISSLLQSHDFAVRETKLIHSQDTYFDSGEFSLYYMQHSLRIRRVGGKYQMTFKHGPRLYQNVLGRVELEVPIGDVEFNAATDFPGDVAKEVERTCPGIRPSELAPVVMITSTKRKVVAESGASKVEFSYDEYVATSGVVSSQIMRELEIEAKSIEARVIVSDIVVELMHQLNVPRQTQMPKYVQAINSLGLAKRR
jgi:inorganic triphosphatase YgiF